MANHDKRCRVGWSWTQNVPNGECRTTTYHMVTHGNEQIKEQFSSLLHFHLHSTASLERITAADDQGEIVGA